MKRSILTASLAILLVSGAFGTCVFSNGAASVTAAAPRDDEAQQRFLIKYCYGQYRSQSDIVRCLAQPV